MKGKKKTKIDKLEIVDTKSDVVAPETEESIPPFPIVGIGASAGGLAAFEAFFSAMPDTELGMAFVLVQHLAPHYKSILKDILKRYTKMQVLEVEDGVSVKPNCVYIIPPNKDMALLNGKLQLMDVSQLHALHLPIDYFFRSLAQDLHERAIGIVLSGNGSDGTLGIRSIKGEGGMVMAQEIKSAEYDGMPSSAIATGLVDCILPPEKMPARLISYVSNSFGNIRRSIPPMIANDENSLKKICLLIRAQTGHDFSQYKENTILRRTQRRMALHQIESFDNYVKYLQNNNAEAQALYSDILIGVTSFFRDAEAFKALNEQIIPTLFEGKSHEQAIRVWVVGCSTGEEAFSLAMLLYEHMEKIKKTFTLQIFATDIDKRAITHSRAGIYPANIAADVSKERLARFFIREPDNSYRVGKNIRDMLIFSEQDVIKDPPFSRMDLIVCRNLLIYMNSELQKRIISLFHYALRKDGALFLGSSESIGEFTDHFSAIDRKWKLYLKEETQSPDQNKFLPSISQKRFSTGIYEKAPVEKKKRFSEIVKQILITQYTPSCVLINKQGDICYVHGRSGKYLEAAPGIASMNILTMARKGLERDLPLAIHEVLDSRKKFCKPGIRVKTNGEFTSINLIVQLVPAVLCGSTVSDLLLVIFEEIPEDRSKQTDKFAHSAALEDSKESSSEANERIAALEQELQDKTEYIEITKNELSTSNEELKSSNEEMQSVNEEIQSTNEELETSKEELQSLNEELSTVNAELQTKVSDLTTAYNDINNLLAGTGIGTIFVDCNVCIKRFTPPVTKVINLIPTDVGRPIEDIVSSLVGYDRLSQDVQCVLDTLIPKEIEVLSKSGAWYLLRILPYRTIMNVIEGAVISFVNITEIKHAQNSLRRMAVIVNDSYNAIIMHDINGQILAWNPSAQKMYGYSENEALKMNVLDTIPKKRHSEYLNYVQRLIKAEVIEPYFTKRVAKNGKIIKIQLIATALLNGNKEIYAIATTERVVDGDLARP